MITALLPFGMILTDIGGSGCGVYTARVETSFRLSENNLYLNPNAKALVCRGSLYIVQ